MHWQSSKVVNDQKPRCAIMDPTEGAIRKLHNFQRSLSRFQFE